MLQDTDFFEKLPGWLAIGDVHVQIQWEESPGLDERYDVGLTYRFRGKAIGHANLIIAPVVGVDEYMINWGSLEFVEEWQDKGLFSQTLAAWVDNGPRYGVTSIMAGPRDKEVEAIFAASGFEWGPRGFVVDLEGEPVRKWRKALSDKSTP